MADRTSPGPWGESQVEFLVTSQGLAGVPGPRRHTGVEHVSALAPSSHVKYSTPLAAGVYDYAIRALVNCGRLQQKHSLIGTKTGFGRCVDYLKHGQSYIAMAR